MVRNSLGYSWKLTGSNDHEPIQLAIRCLCESVECKPDTLELEECTPRRREGRLGTVWVEGDAHIRQPIQLESGVILDFLGHGVFLDFNGVCIELNGCYNAVVRNLRIFPFANQKSPLIKLHSTSNAAEDATSYNLIEDVWISNCSEFECYGCLSVECTCTQGVGDPLVAVDLSRDRTGILRGNTISRLYIERVKSVIRFSGNVTFGGFCSMNRFTNIYAHSCDQLVDFDLQYAGTEKDGMHCLENTFDHVVGNTTDIAAQVTNAIETHRNYFEQVGYVDLQTAEPAPSQSWTVSENATHTIISGIGPIELNDRGTETLVTSPLPVAIENPV